MNTHQNSKAEFLAGASALVARAMQSGLKISVRPPEPVKRRGPSRKWSEYDWSKSNKELAHEHGISESNVSRARGKFAPQTRTRK